MTYTHARARARVESEYGSNENYDGNDGFSTPQIENETRKNTLLFSTTDTNSQLAAHGSSLAVFTVRSS